MVNPTIAVHFWPCVFKKLKQTNIEEKLFLNLKPSREQLLIGITAIGVVIESLLVYQYLNTVFPNIKQMGNLEAIFVEIGIAIFLTVTVYQYSTKSERDRKIRLRKQIISSFEMLCIDFAWLVTQKTSPSINEEFITKKNLRIFHIQNLIAALPEKLGVSMSIQIPEFCEKALLVPVIKRSLNSNEPIIIDYTGCEGLILNAKEIMQDLHNKWKGPKTFTSSDNTMMSSRINMLSDNKKEKIWKTTENKLMIISIIIALAIGVPTAFLAYETDQALGEINKITTNDFFIQNFQWDMSANVESIMLENRIYDNESLNNKISLSVVSPHHLKIVVNKVEIQNEDQNIVLPRVYLEEAITRFLPSGVSNIDINVPIRLSFDPNFIKSDFDNNEIKSLGDITFYFEITDIQTKEQRNGFAHSSLTFAKIIPVGYS